MLRLVFAGTADFSVPSLRACAEHHEVVAAVSQPGRPGDRGHPAPRPVADAAAALGIPVLTPEKLREAVDEVAALGADALVVAAYGQIVPESLLRAHRLGGINVHASLLPRWRGASPIAAAILAGDRETGVCIMQMEAGLDTGPVFACESIAIADHSTTPSLTAQLADSGAELLLRVLADVEGGVAAATPQPEDGVTYAGRLRREDGHLDWTAVTAGDVDRRIRALQPWPGVTAPLGGQDVRIISGNILGDAPHTEAGAVVQIAKDRVGVGTADGVFEIHTVQPPGKRPMDAAAYLRGVRISGGTS